MRYLGGLLGGSWMTAMTGDLGAGKFDGAWLVSNFESGNPANTYWTKQYEVWADVDRAAERYLGFEKWWGGHVTLNAAEMQFIVDQLFIGNRLATRRADLRRRDAGGPAQHRLADHRLLLGGRRHHAAGAGAVLGERPLQGPRRPAHARADHRLFRPWQHRPSRHLRLRRRGDGRSTTSSRPTWT